MMDNWNKNKKYLYSIFGIILFAIFFLLFFIQKQRIYLTYNLFNTFSFIITMIIITIWGLYILYRIFDKVTYNLFINIVFLSLIWLFIALIKFLIPATNFCRYLWYLYYYPILFLPVFWLSIIIKNFSKLDYKKILFLTSIISGILFLIVITNDLHNFVFIFNSGLKNWSKVYSHNFIFYIIYIYIFILIIISVLIYIIGTIKHNNFWSMFAPLLVEIIMFAYSIIYLYDFHIIKNIPIIRNMTIVYILLSFLMIESALSSGMIQNSGKYGNLYLLSQIPLGLYNNEYEPIFINKNFIWNDKLRNKDNIILINNYKYIKQKISGGYLIKQEDLTSIIKLQNQLNEELKELKRTNKILSNKKEVKNELEKLKVKKELLSKIDKIKKESQSEILSLEASLPNKLKKDNKEETLTKLRLLKIKIAFLKQKLMFLLNSQKNGYINCDELKISMNSLLTDCNKDNFNSVSMINGNKNIETYELLFMNDMLNKIITKFFNDAQMIINIDTNKKVVKIRISTKIDTDLTILLKSKDNRFKLTINHENNFYEIIIKEVK
jgi:hypothetical protein